MPDTDLATADGQDRYVPTATRDITSAGHAGVYEWVAENLVRDGMRALDFGWGTGYGVALMAGAGATVDGADSSHAAVAYATETYGGPHARFFVADLLESLPAADMDWAVGQVAICHKPRRDGALTGG
jgi:SAM-dependent methyltransferase